MQIVIVALAEIRKLYIFAYYIYDIYLGLKVREVLARPKFFFILSACIHLKNYDPLIFGNNIMQPPMPQHPISAPANYSTFFHTFPEK